MKLLDEFEEEVGLDRALELWKDALERSGIREHDGGTPRRRADTLAIADIVTRLRRAGETDSGFLEKLQGYLERKFGRARKS